MDVVTAATVTTVGARAQCLMTQDHRRGSGVAPDPDKWLDTGTISAGGGHGLVLNSLTAMVAYLRPLF